MAGSVDNAQVLGCVGVRACVRVCVCVCVCVCVFASSWNLEVSDPMFISIKVASESAAILTLMDVGSEKF